MHLLDGVVRHYDWGSPSAIPSLIGRPEDGRPWAELWFGAHPSAPATVGSSGTTLDAFIAADPVAALGPAGAERFESLPFLVKILAAAAPLSLQAHPSRPQAEAGFAREDAAGVPIGAPHRNFRDPNHKPEIVCALTDFRALCGFRPVAETLRVLATIDTDALDPIRNRLRDAAPSAQGAVLAELLADLLSMPADEAAATVAAVATACATSSAPDHVAEREMAVDLAARHPGDAGVVIALLLNLVELVPGEALFLGAGNLHAYLGGLGVEVMANSDNVLRGGLTSKHVDVATLLEVVDATPIVPNVQRPAPVDGVVRYASPVPEFAVARVDVDGASVCESGPAIVVCVAGTVDIGPHTLDSGAAAWIPADDPPATFEGRGTVYRAGMGRPSPG